jgi:hypothetical protein
MHEFSESPERRNDGIIAWPGGLEAGQQYERIIDYVDGYTGTQVFRFNNEVTDEDGTVSGINVTFQLLDDQELTKTVSVETLGLSGPVNEMEKSRGVREILPPDQR